MSESSGGTAADRHFLDQIAQATQGAARLLCTLARRGKTIERDDPQRASYLLKSARTHPLYKGGRLAFDMLEIEDLILEAADVPSMTTRETVETLSVSVQGLGAMLRRIGLRVPATHDFRQTHEVQEPASPPLPRVTLGPAVATDAANPHESPLLASDYLYDFVVLGFLDLAGPIAAMQP